MLKVGGLKLMLSKLIRMGLGVGKVADILLHLGLM